jgi:hypothetical protein
MGFKFWQQIIRVMILLSISTGCVRAPDQSLIPEENAVLITTISPNPEPTAAPSENQNDINSGITVVPVKTETVPVLVPTNTPSHLQSCSIGLGLREETIEVLLANKKQFSLMMAASVALAEKYFPQFEGWFRILGAPSLSSMNDKASRAYQSDIPYEGLGYGLETSITTPEAEWRNLLVSTQQAGDLADEYAKQLVMGPGFRLLSRNEDLYGPMAALADVWLLQTQQLQKDSPGPEYRMEVERIVSLIRSENPNILIWAQITLPPDREPDAEEWLDYRGLILDLVDGTYIGVYTWDRVDKNILIKTIESIFESACSDNY